MTTTTTTTTAKLRVRAPAVPGAVPSVVGTADTLAAARRIAREYRHRRDLVGHDVRIELASGRCIEHAGPCR